MARQLIKILAVYIVIVVGSIAVLYEEPPHFDHGRVLATTVSLRIDCSSSAMGITGGIGWSSNNCQEAGVYHIHYEDGCVIEASGPEAIVILLEETMRLTSEYSKEMKDLMKTMKEKRYQ